MTLMVMESAATWTTVLPSQIQIRLTQMVMELETHAISVHLILVRSLRELAAVELPTRIQM